MVIAEHQVSLDDPADSSQVDALGDLYGYVRWHIDPLWRDEEQRIIPETSTGVRDAGPRRRRHRRDYRGGAGHGPGLGSPAG